MFERRELFQPATNAINNEPQLGAVLSDGVVLNLNQPAIEKILKENVEFLTLPLPNGKGGSIELELVKVNIFASGFTVKTSKPTTELIEESLGIHYRGIVKGNDHSLAAISIFKNEVMGFYSTEAEGNSVLGRLGGNNPTDKHILYAEKDLKVRPNFHCDTKDDGVTLPASLLQSPDQVLARCIRIYLEANYDLFLNKGSVTNTTSYLTGMFNQSATLFSNDGIPVSISEFFVWNSPSPYNGTDSQAVLNQFRTTRTSFNGDLAHLITLDRQFGGIAYINAVCNNSLKYGVSDIDPTYSTVPTYSWTVNVFTHETGHNLGSPHTHACAWNGNNTAIDACGPTAGYPYEGTCSGAPLPSNGGTMMSYCHLVQGVGINFTLGFGTQPRNLIVNRFNAAACLSDCGGGGCPSTSISPGQTINGSLSTSDCVFTGTTRYVDVYGFNGTAGQRVAVSMNSSAFDTYLYLVNASNQIIGEDDDGGGGTNSRIPATSGFFALPATGSYSIWASSYSANSTGAYSISLVNETVTPLRIDNVTPKAGRIAGGQSINLSGAFAGLSTVTIGGNAVSWSYTSGTSAIAFTSPAHAVGAVDIVLTPSSGSTYTKTNAFAYLPTVFTDDTLVAGVTSARVQHITELRQAVDALRAVAGQGAASWTDPMLLPFTNSIKAVHITELRTNLNNAAAALGYSTAAYTDPTLGVGFQIKLIHVEELRQRIRAIAG